jgi:hypothetical protein
MHGAIKADIVIYITGTSATCHPHQSICSPATALGALCTGRTRSTLQLQGAAWLQHAHIQVQASAAGAGGQGDVRLVSSREAPHTQGATVLSSYREQLSTGCSSPRSASLSHQR